MKWMQPILRRLRCATDTAGAECTPVYATNSFGAAPIAGYTPSGAKKFKILGISIIVTNSTSSSRFAVGYNDNDCGIDPSTSCTFANEVFFFNQDTAPTNHDNHLWRIETGAAGLEKSTFFPVYNAIVPNGKHLFLGQLDGGSFHRYIVYGVEID